MLKARCLFVPAMIAVGAAQICRADAEHYDVSPEIVAGKITTNAYFDSVELEVKNVRVFGYLFGEDIVLPPNQLQDPGLHPLPGISGFAPGSQIGVRAASVLKYWSGAAPTFTPSFSPAAPGTSLTYAFASSSATVTGSTIPANNVLLGPVDANGGFDDHLDTEITLTAPHGVYLVDVTLNTTMTGVLDSDPIYFLFGYGVDDETLEEAKVFIRDTFAPGTVLPVIPEPAASALLAGSMLICSRRSRR